MSIANPVDHRAIRVAIRIRYHFWRLRASLISAPLAARLPMSLAKTKTATRNSGRTDRANSRASEWINSISMHIETADRMRLKFHQTNQTSRFSPLASRLSSRIAQPSQTRILSLESSHLESYRPSFGRSFRSIPRRPLMEIRQINSNQVVSIPYHISTASSDGDTRSRDHIKLTHKSPSSSHPQIHCRKLSSLESNSRVLWPMRSK